MRSVFSLAAGAAVLAGLGAAACGSSSVPYSAPSVEQHVSAQIFQRTGIQTAIQCPSSLPNQNLPVTVQCVVTTPSGDTDSLTVTIQDAEGQYVWRTG